MKADPQLWDSLGAGPQGYNPTGAQDGQIEKKKNTYTRTWTHKPATYKPQQLPVSK